MSTTSPRQVLRPVRKGMEIDEVALLQYMRREGVVPEHVKKIHLLQFGHGQSNPTYLIQAGKQEIVLRKQPPGKLLASAHAVHREFEVMKALRSASLAVPSMLALCKDPTIVGTTFFLMACVDGKLMLDPNMPAFEASQRRAAYTAMGETLARLHSVDPAAVGLGSFGKPQAFCARQVHRWLQQYNASTSPSASSSAQAGVNPRLPEMLQLAKWLQEHAPAADACAGPPCIVHGDFRLDNLVLGESMEVRAVLDWELATLGNPMSDLSYNCLTYNLPTVPALPRFTTPLPAGIPSEADYVAAYCAARCIRPPSPADWAFFMSLSIFRAAAILAGVYARALAGNASSASAHTAGAPSTVQDMAAAALKLIAAAPGVPFQHAASSTASGSVPQGLAPPVPHSAMSAACAVLQDRLREFVDQRIYPASKAFSAHTQSDARWRPFPQMEALKAAARAEGLWNLWISKDLSKCLQKLLEGSAELTPVERELLAGPGLSNVDYAHLAKVMGEVLWSSEVFNCSAPDTGNMEVLSRYGSPAQQRRWLLPLLRGDIRSCFAMTEPAVASSDATNVQGSIRRVGSDYVVNGHKIWISGACDSRCKVIIFMGKTDPTAAPHQQQSMILVPMDAPGVQIKRPMTVFGADDAPHGHAEMLFSDVRVGADNVVLGEGRGFEIAQGRLGPGRLHHCMRMCGAGDLALRLVAARVLERKAFGATLAKSPLVQAQLAEAWLKLHCAWLSVLHAAGRLDSVGNKAARQDITAAKVVVPQAVLSVIDTAIQLHGAAGVGQDTALAGLWGAVRTLRLADGPDEVHLMALGKQVVKKYGSYEASRSKL